MSELEPEDPIEASCPDCGEEEDIEHIDGSLWNCLICKETFGDGSDSDNDYDLAN